MPRFFVQKENIDPVNGIVKIVGEDALHIARSLRMATGESITVCDGEGYDYECRLDRIRDSECLCEITSSAPSGAEPPYKVKVFQALVKGERMDTVIQKSVEFGATEIVPFESSRCIVRLKGEREGSKSIRRRRIAAEAAKQCGRGIVPDVREPISFADMLREAADCDLSLFCYEKESGALLGELIANRGKDIPQTVAIIVGPEGGFAPEEAERAVASGIVSVGLGKRILRTESAATFVLAVLSGFWELS